MRIDSGPGYRVYFVGRGNAVFVLLCGGDIRPITEDKIPGLVAKFSESATALPSSATPGNAVA